jgi:hypothetical protein
MEKPQDKIASIDAHIREMRSFVQVMIDKAELDMKINDQMINCLYILEQKLDTTINISESLTEDFDAIMRKNEKADKK